MARVALSIGLLALLATQLDFGRVGNQLVTLQWPALTLALSLALFDRVIVTGRWAILLRASDVRLGFSSLFSFQMIAGFLGSFLPTGVSVDVIRIYLVSSRSKKTIEAVAASVVDRLTMVLTILVTAIITITIAGTTNISPRLQNVLLTATLVAVVVVLLLSVGRFARRIGVLLRPLVGSRLVSFFGRYYWGIHQYHRQRPVLAAAFALSAAAMLLRVGIAKALTLALGVEVSFLALLTVLPLAWVILMLPISIGNLGVQEGAYVLLLGFLGVDTTSAISISLLDHAVVRVVSLPGAIMWLRAKRRDPHLGRDARGRMTPGTTQDEAARS